MRNFWKVCLILGVVMLASGSAQAANIYRDSVSVVPPAFLLDSDGTTAAASATFAAGAVDALDLTDFHMTALVDLDAVDTTHIFFQRKWGDNIVTEFGIGSADNKVYLKIGWDNAGTWTAVTYQGATPVLAAAHLNRPLEVSISQDGANDELVACIDGICSAVDTSATDADTGNTTAVETITIGNLDGSFLGLWIGSGEPFAASSYHMPMSLSQGPFYTGLLALWVANYDRGYAQLIEPVGALTLKITGDWEHIE